MTQLAQGRCLGMKRILGFLILPAVIAVASTAGLRSPAEAKKKGESERGAHQLARLSEEVSIRAAGRGNPYINLGDGHDLLTQYEGENRLVTALESNQAKPLSLASADFDEDGVPDLASGYDGAGGGIVCLHRG